ncbi:hypothetical protein R70723_14355 [Paenibacillus sp. FSL R7-0273]|uniref:cupin domain-containing protein n=1 Tax=Paenibacillus sp. FSL R7-0273 TaxID=1536772 RepID=UPI0004F8E9A1|nr:cupin domain-containing protein [Paenibacillus sp. FSL R7-0273]AIQ46927.1 hypothetical protein R70723_14355 [Paenibacillus sp. FSL R7-0273]OMF97311.1 hypothetical protein BK144_01260 [Paenibacillus sp. FSL R7-0273]
MSGISAGTPFSLKNMIDIKPHRIASRPLSFEGLPGRDSAAPEWVLYAMAQDETISSETSPFAKLIHVLEGELHMLVDGSLSCLTEGTSLWVQADTWHEFAAPAGAKFLQIRL